jgi:hypothetical protein
MRISVLTTVLLGLAGTVHAAEKVNVYINSNAVPLDVIGIAKGISSQIFATADVAVEWHSVFRTAHRVAADRTVVVDFRMETPASVPSETMAYAMPFEGIHIVVFWKRVLSHTRDNPLLLAPILGHVMTHEITHALQGLDHHSSSGVMKARWDAADYADMTKSPLLFDTGDIDLLRLGLVRRRAISK